MVAHFHYVMMGGTVIAFIGGLHYWWPKMTGRMYNEIWGRIACVLVFIGFNMTFFTQFILGSRGMPRRYYNYLAQFQPLHAFRPSAPGFWPRASSSPPHTCWPRCASRWMRPTIPGAARRWSGRLLRRPSTHNFEEQPVLQREPYDYRPEPVAHE